MGFLKYVFHTDYYDHLVTIFNLLIWCIMQFDFLNVDPALYGEGNGTPLQYSCLENPMDRGAWWAAVQGVAKSRTRLSDFTFTFTDCLVIFYCVPDTEFYLVGYWIFLCTYKYFLMINLKKTFFCCTRSSLLHEGFL